MKRVSLATALRTAGAQLGLAISYPSPGVIERIGADWDWIWIDGQHGEISESEALELVRACDLVGRPALVRVSGHDPGAIGKALDTGAAGVIVPCVDTVDQARSVAAAAKFPPLGNRSYGGRRPIDLAGRGYAESANVETLCVVQIESPEALENAHAIAALPGVDALFLGPDDMLLRRGFDMNHPRNPETLGGDMRKVAEACRAHGKAAATVGVGSEMLGLCLELGYQLIVGGSDVLFLAGGSQRASTEARTLLDSRKGASHAGVAAEPTGGSPY